VWVLGSKGSVPDAAMETARSLTEAPKSDASAQRVFGPDRYATGVAINTKFASSFATSGPGSAITVATGTNFPDALAGGVFAAKQKAPLFLVNGAATTPNATVRTAISNWKVEAVETVYVFGGTSSVSSTALTIHVS